MEDEAKADSRAGLGTKGIQERQVCQVLQVQGDPEETKVNGDQRGRRVFLDVRETQDELDPWDKLDVLVLLDRRANQEIRALRGSRDRADHADRRVTMGRMD